MDASAYNMSFDKEQLSVLCANYDRRIDALAKENAKLREACAELLRMAERHDPEWLHWPEMHEELRKLGVKIVKI